MGSKARGVEIVGGRPHGTVCKKPVCALVVLLLNTRPRNYGKIHADESENG